MKKHFMAVMPDEPFAQDVYAENEDDVREELRRRYKLNRLPRGVTVWEADTTIHDDYTAQRRHGSASPYSAYAS